MLTADRFQQTVLRQMRKEGLTVRRILRVYPPYDSQEPTEVLFVSLDGKPGTVYVGHDGAVVRGPLPGFGE